MAVNALINLRPVLGSRLEFTISDNNAVLTIPRSSGGGESGLLLQVEDVDNAVQSTLNLISGDGIQIEDGGDGSVTITNNATLQYKITAISANTITAKTWDGTTLGSTAVTIAKQGNARESVTSLVFSGKTFAIEYTGNTRELTSTDTVFEETLVPGYNVDDLIFAVEVENGTDIETVDFLEVSPFRSWVMNLALIEYRNADCVDKFRYVPATDEETPT